MASSKSKRDEFITRLYVDHFEGVRRAVARQYGQGIAEDATQFAFLQAVRGKLAVDHPTPRAWLITVARNEALGMVTKVRGEVESLDAEDAASTRDLADPNADPALAAEINESIHLLRLLKPQEATVLFLIGAGWSYDEIVEALDKTNTWVNRYATEGRVRLRSLAGGGE